jgi:hypothetical protein
MQPAGKSRNMQKFTSMTNKENSKRNVNQQKLSSSTKKVAKFPSPGVLSLKFKVPNTNANKNIPNFKASGTAKKGGKGTKVIAD